MSNSRKQKYEKPIIIDMGQATKGLAGSGIIPMGYCSTGGSPSGTGRTCGTGSKPGPGSTCRIGSGVDSIDPHCDTGLSAI